MPLMNITNGVFSIFLSHCCEFDDCMFDDVKGFIFTQNKGLLMQEELTILTITHKQFFK